MAYIWTTWPFKKPIKHHFVETSSKFHIFSVWSLIVIITVLAIKM
jgi:hypothetical protein